MPAATVTLHSVTFGYSRRKPVVRALSVQLGPRPTIVLGPNGAGKTTLLSLAASCHQPWHGSVLLNGAVTARGRRGRREFRSRVGWLPQRAEYLPGLSAREQVAYAGWLKGMSRSAPEHSSPRRSRARTSWPPSCSGSRPGSGCRGGRSRGPLRQHSRPGSSPARCWPSAFS
jgi:ABC-type multidrug transport system ATPase subunit